MDTRLPHFCARRDELEGITILKRGETGFWPGKVMALETDEDVERFNKQHGATPAAVEAMRFGSLFGFNTPGAQLEAGEDMAARKAARG